MDHVRTSPYIRRATANWSGGIKPEVRVHSRPKTPLRIDEARRLVSAYVDDYNQRRLHSAIGYVTPADKLAGKAPAIQRIVTGSWQKLVNDVPKIAGRNQGSVQEACLRFDPNSCLSLQPRHLR